MPRMFIHPSHSSKLPDLHCQERVLRLFDVRFVFMRNFISSDLHRYKRLGNLSAPSARTSYALISDSVLFIGRAAHAFSSVSGLVMSANRLWVRAWLSSNRFEHQHAPLVVL
jgi:hypothetical protein